MILLFSELLIFICRSLWLALSSFALVLADARPAALPARASSAFVLADARPTALLASASHAVVLADAQAAAWLAVAFWRLCSQMMLDPPHCGRSLRITLSSYESQNSQTQRLHCRGESFNMIALHCSGNTNIQDRQPDTTILYIFYSFLQSPTSTPLSAVWPLPHGV